MLLSVLGVNSSCSLICMRRQQELILSLDMQSHVGCRAVDFVDTFLWMSQTSSQERGRTAPLLPAPPRRSLSSFAEIPQGCGRPQPRYTSVTDKPGHGGRERGGLGGRYELLCRHTGTTMLCKRSCCNCFPTNLSVKVQRKNTREADKRLWEPKRIHFHTDIYEKISLSSIEKGKTVDFTVIWQ